MTTVLDNIIDEAGMLDLETPDGLLPTATTQSTTVVADEFENLDTKLENGKIAILDSSDSLEKEIIPPDDNRSKVTNLISPPYRWICNIETAFYSTVTSARIRGGGTGLLIGDRFILTAAHVLHTDFGKHGIITANSVIIYPGRDGVRRTFGTYGYESFRYLNAWKNSLDTRFDFAIIKLKRAPGTRNFPSKTGDRPLGWWGNPSYGYGTIIKGGSKNVFAGRKVNLAGYPTTEPRTGRSISGSPTQWLSFDSLHQIAPKFNGRSVSEMISYKSDATKSQSGAPIWTYDDRTGERNLVAIHHGSCKNDAAGCVSNWDGCCHPGSSQGSYNLGVHISTNVKNQIQQWKQNM